MSSRALWLCVLLVAVVGAGSWLRSHEEAGHASIPTSAVQQPATLAAAARDASLEPSVAAHVSASAPDGVTLAAKPARVEQLEEIGLQVDAKGHLIKNPQTRDELERILDGDPVGIEARRQELVELLPPAASQEALDLLERFVNYRAALREAIPDTSGTLTEQDALIMLDAAHNLRVAYFGAESTEAFFGAEEAIGRGTAEGILKAGSEVR